MDNILLYNRLAHLIYGFYDDFNRTANKIIISDVEQMRDMSTEYLRTFGLEIAATVLI